MSVFTTVPKKGNAKECSNYRIIALISYASKVMLKSFKLALSSSWTENFQMYKLGFKETEEPEIKLPTFIKSQRKQGSSRKSSISASLTMLKHFTVWITTNWKILKMMWIPDHLTSPLRKLWVKKQLLQPDIGRHTGSKLGKEYDKAVYCHPAYLTYMRSTWYEMPDWMKSQAVIKITGRNISNLRHADDNSLMA